MAINVLTIDGLTDRKLKTIAENVITGPQATIVERVNNINTTHRLNLGVTKTFRWSPGIYDQIKEKLTEYNGFNMSNSGMYHLFRRMEGNNTYWKRNLRQNVVTLENELKNLRDQGAIWQDNSDSVLDIYASVKEQLNNTYQNINDDVEFSYDIIEQTDDHDDIMYSEYKLRFIIKYNNIDVHMWTRRNHNYLGAIPMGEVTLNIQMNLLRALNTLSARQNSLFNIVRLPSGYCSEGQVFALKALFDNDTKARHPFIGSLSNTWSSPRNNVAFCQETQNDNWRNVCLGNMGSELAINCVNFDLNSINGEFKKWLSNFIVNETNPLNSFRTWFHGFPKWLQDNETLHEIIGHRGDPEDCTNAFRIYEIIEEIDNGDRELEDIDPMLEYCHSNDCQLKTDCAVYRRYGDANIQCQLDQLIQELSEIWCAPEYIHDFVQSFKHYSVAALDLIVYKESGFDRSALLTQCMDLESVLYPDKIYADVKAYVSLRGFRMYNSQTLINHIDDLKTRIHNIGQFIPIQGGIIDTLLNDGEYSKELYEDDGSLKALRRTSIDMSDEEMIRTLQNRMNMIPTARVTNTNTSRGNIHGGEDPMSYPDDDEVRINAAMNAEDIWNEAYQRDTIENPEPNNLEEE